MFLPHGWFLAFAPVDAPRIALAVLVEHGGSGSEAAAPVAREILAAFFGSRAETGPTPGAVQATAQAMPVEPSRTARASAATAGRE
jgi:penicillin-binding protein 2